MKNTLNRIKVYEYKNCSSCKKALKLLDSKKIPYQAIPIVDQPPSLQELKAMLAYLKKEGETFKKLFNTSGIQYREMNISEKIKNGMDEAEALALLSKHGKLIKRPFLLSENLGVVGFNEAQWEALLK